MASLGHLAVGMAAARVSQPGSSARRASLTAILLWSALSFLPDADVVGFGLGVRYEDEWGHRGATHSFVFSLLLGSAIGLVAPLFRLPALRTGTIASLVLASHALLDILTNGGLGCALFWPFDLTRYFAPWTPIPVSPIGLNFLTPYGFSVALTELVLFAPLMWYALTAQRVANIEPAARRRRGLALPAGVWVLGVWLLMGSDPIRERIVRLVLWDDTEFAPSFSEERLDAVERGQTPEEVLGLVGPPLLERPRAPGETCWLYSRSPDGGYFRLRAVCFTDAGVRRVLRRWLRE